MTTVNLITSEQITTNTYLNNVIDQIKTNHIECFGCPMINLSTNMKIYYAIDNMQTVVASLIINEQDITYNNKIFIYSVCTNKNVRNKGYMTNLFNILFQHYPYNDMYLDVSYNNTFKTFMVLVNFYAKLGFTAVDNRIINNDQRFVMCKYNNNTEIQPVSPTVYINYFEYVKTKYEIQTKFAKIDSYDNLSIVNNFIENQSLYYYPNFLPSLNDNCIYCYSHNKLIGMIIYDTNDNKINIIQNLFQYRYEKYGLQYCMLYHLLQVFNPKDVSVRISYDTNYNAFIDNVLIYVLFNFKTIENTSNYLTLSKSSSAETFEDVKTIESKVSIGYKEYHKNKFFVKYDNIDDNINDIIEKKKLDLTLQQCIEVMYTIIINKFFDVDYIKNILNKISEHNNHNNNYNHHIYDELYELCLICDNFYIALIIDDSKNFYVERNGFGCAKYKNNKILCETEMYPNKLLKCRYDDTTNTCNRIPMTINKYSKYERVFGISSIYKLNVFGIDLYLIGEHHTKYNVKHSDVDNTTINIKDLLFSIESYWANKNKQIDIFLEAYYVDLKNQRRKLLYRPLKVLNANMSNMFDFIDQHDNLLNMIDESPDYKFNDVFKYNDNIRLHYVDMRRTDDILMEVNTIIDLFNNNIDENYDKYYTELQLKQSKTLSEFENFIYKLYNDTTKSKDEHINAYATYIVNKYVIHRIKYYTVNTNIFGNIKQYVFKYIKHNMFLLIQKIDFDKLMKNHHETNRLKSKIIVLISMIAYAHLMDAYTLLRIFKTDNNNKLMFMNNIVYAGVAHTINVLGFFSYLLQYSEYTTNEIKILNMSKSENDDGYVNISNFVQPFFEKDDSISQDYIFDSTHVINMLSMYSPCKDVFIN